MVRFLINRPVAVLMTFTAILVLSIFAAMRIPVSLLPDINIPIITVRIASPGTPALEMEQSVVKTVRLQLMQVPGLDDIESEARDGDATITLKFDYGADVDYLFVEVNEKIDMAMAYLPRSISRPRVIKASATDLPVFNLNIMLKDSSGSNPEQMLGLSQLASNVFRKRLEQLPEVAFVDITGTVTPELEIRPIDARIVPLNISSTEVERAIKESMIDIGSIKVREGQLVFNVIVDSRVKHPDDLKHIPIRVGTRVFELGELAEIGIKPERAQGVFYYNGKPAVCLPVVKQTTARISDLKQQTDRLIGLFRAESPRLAFDISHDQSVILSLSLSNLRNSLIVGIILAVGAIFLFLGDLRSPTLMAVTIPVSLVISIMIIYLMGLSVNIVSLSGLILGVGMMIDNSIVVIDNITQWRLRGYSLEESTVAGTNEVIRPLLSSMLTTCAVFLPLVFLSGLSGALFYDQAVAVSVGLLISFFVSITLLPTVYFRLNSRGNGKWVEKAGYINLEDKYEKGFRYLFSRRRTFFAVLVAFVLLSPFYFKRIAKRQMPELTRSETIVNVSWGNNISVEENALRCNALRERLIGLYNQTAFLIGKQQLLLSKGLDMDESDASLYFRCDSPGQLAALKDSISKYFQENHPQITTHFASPETVFDRIFPAPEAKLVVQVYDSRHNTIPDQKTLDDVYSSIMADAPQAQVERIPMRNTLRLRINHEVATLYKVSTPDIQEALEVALQSNQIGQLTFEQQVIKIVYGNPPAQLDRVLATSHVTNKDGSAIPLRGLLTQEESMEYRSIFGGKGGAYIPIRVNAPDNAIARIQNSLRLNDLKSDQFSVAFAGEYLNSKRVLWELLVVLSVSVLLLFFILAAQFESLVQPLLVLLEIPLDLVGVILLLWVSGQSLNLMSLIGLVVMGGIVVNDSILKIDTTNRLRVQGYALMAAIEEAGRRRLKPIIMTSLTTILALVPILFGRDLGSELQQPLAIATIGGLLIGTFFSLYLIPMIYWRIYRKTNSRHQQVRPKSI